MELAAAAHPVLVVDGGAVTFADSSALNLLLRMHQVTTLRLANPSAPLARLLRITGADQVLNVFPTLDQACSAAV
ncbi:STAS domain-containing protein [Streptomyces sp. NPDC102487]|uniref:STAS domain-containing protein n=1 Tax=Streptomyces sp. NPDC102487 TaxID=3366182 RepID=UPI00381AD74F